jgi:hypothetical protein
VAICKGAGCPKTKNEGTAKITAGTIPPASSNSSNNTTVSYAITIKDFTYAQKAAYGNGYISEEEDDDDTNTIQSNSGTKLSGAQSNTNTPPAKAAAQNTNGRTPITLTDGNSGPIMGINAEAKKLLKDYRIKDEGTKAVEPWYWSAAHTQYELSALAGEYVIYIGKGPKLDTEAVDQQIKELSSAGAKFYVYKIVGFASKYQGKMKADGVEKAEAKLELERSRTNRISDERQQKRMERRQGRLAKAQKLENNGRQTLEQKFYNNPEELAKIRAAQAELNELQEKDDAAGNGYPSALTDTEEKRMNELQDYLEDNMDGRRTESRLTELMSRVNKRKDITMSPARVERYLSVDHNASVTCTRNKKLIGTKLDPMWHQGQDNVRIDCGGIYNRAANLKTDAQRSNERSHIFYATINNPGDITYAVLIERSYNRDWILKDFRRFALGGVEQYNITAAGDLFGRDALDAGKSVTYEADFGMAMSKNTELTAAGVNNRGDESVAWEIPGGSGSVLWVTGYADYGESLTRGATIQSPDARGIFGDKYKAGQQRAEYCNYTWNCSGKLCASSGDYCFDYDGSTKKPKFFHAIREGENLAKTDPKALTEGSPGIPEYIKNMIKNGTTYDAFEGCFNAMKQAHVDPCTQLCKDGENYYFYDTEKKKKLGVVQFSDKVSIDTTDAKQCPDEISAYKIYPKDDLSNDNYDTDKRTVAFNNNRYTFGIVPEAAEVKKATCCKDNNQKVTLQLYSVDGRAESPYTLSMNPRDPVHYTEAEIIKACKVGFGQISLCQEEDKDFTSLATCKATLSAIFWTNNHTTMFDKGKGAIDDDEHRTFSFYGDAACNNNNRPIAGNATVYAHVWVGTECKLTDAYDYDMKADKGFEAFKKCLDAGYIFDEIQVNGYASFDEGAANVEKNKTLSQKRANTAGKVFDALLKGDLNESFCQTAGDTKESLELAVKQLVCEQGELSSSTRTRTRNSVIDEYKHATDITQNHTLSNDVGGKIASKLIEFRKTYSTCPIVKAGGKGTAQGEGVENNKYASNQRIELVAAGIDPIVTGGNQTVNQVITEVVNNINKYDCNDVLNDRNQSPPSRSSPRNENYSSPPPVEFLPKGISFPVT